MLSLKGVASILASGLVTATICTAQFAISTHSGLIQLTMGSVFLEDQPIHKTATSMLEVKQGQVLRTGRDGNSEILLTPGVFLRLGNDTSIRMDSNALSNTHVSLLTGSAMVECDELLAGNAVSFTIGTQPVELRKKGLYRLEASPAAIASVKGEAFVAGSINTTVKQGRLLQLDSAAPEPVKFKLNKKDDLYAFSKARAEDSVYATGVTSASLYNSGSTGCTGSSWYPMSGVGMYSYLPCNGIYSSPFGYSFLGLNSGYMWGGPMYYAAPYALYGYGSGFVGGGGGGRPQNVNMGGQVASNNGNGAPAGGKGNPPKGLLPSNGAPRPVPPIFAAPGFRGNPQAMAAARAALMNNNPGMHNSGMHNSGMHGGASAVHSMAGPSIGRSAGAGASSHASFGSGGGGGGSMGSGRGAGGGMGSGGGMGGGAARSSGGGGGSGGRSK